MQPSDFFKLPAQQRDAAGSPLPQFGGIWCNPQGPAHAQVPNSVIQFGGSLYALNAQTAITTVTTAQSLINAANPMAIAPGLLNQPGKLLRLGAAGVYSQGSQTNALTFALTFGGVTLVSLVATIGGAAAITNGQWDLTALITTATAGAAGTLEVHAEVGLQLTATNTTALAWFADVNAAASSSVDLTTAASGGSTLGFTLAATSALTTATLRQLILEVLY